MKPVQASDAERVITFTPAQHSALLINHLDRTESNVRTLRNNLRRVGWAYPCLDGLNERLAGLRQGGATAEEDAQHAPADVARAQAALTEIRARMVGSDDEDLDLWVRVVRDDLGALAQLGVECPREFPEA